MATSVHNEDNRIREMVRDGYAGIARKAGSCCAGASDNNATIAKRVGYTEEQV